MQHPDLDLNMHFIWPLFRSHGGNLNSCFTEVREPETLKMLSELGLNCVVRGKRGEETANWKEKRKGFWNRNLCLFTLRCNSRGVKIKTLNLKILHRYCIWENGQADIRRTRVQKKTDLRISSHFGYHNLVARFV